MVLVTDVPTRKVSSNRALGGTFDSLTARPWSPAPRCSTSWSFSPLTNGRRHGRAGRAAVHTQAVAPDAGGKAATAEVKTKKPERVVKPVRDSPVPAVPTEEDWKPVLQMQAEGKPYVGKIRAVNRGGVLVDVGKVSGFIPFSKLDPSRLPRRDVEAVEKSLDVQELQYLINKPITAKVIQVNVPENKLVMSERAAMTSQLASQLKAGDVVEGIVTRLVDYGAFVSLRSPDGQMHGIEGMVHVSELSWKRVLTPESVVQTGNVVRCLVKRAKGERIELSLKFAEDDPLMETFDSMLPRDEGEVGQVPTQIPSSVEAICQALAQQPDVTAVNLGRQVEEKSVVSQDLELWISREEVEGGYCLVARAGRLVQEIRVSSTLSRDEMKECVQRVLSTRA